MNWKKTAKIAGVAAGVYLLMKYAFFALLPLLFGWLLALLAYPAARKLASFKICRKLHFSEGGIGAFLLLLFSLAGIFLAVEGLKFLSLQVGNLVKWYPTIKKEMTIFIGQCCSKMEYSMGIPAEDSSRFIWLQLTNAADTLVSHAPTMETTVDSIKSCITVIGSIIIGVVSSVLFLQEWREWKTKLEQQKSVQKVKHLFSSLGAGIAAYLKAQVKILSIIILLCIAGLYFMGIKHFIVWGAALGILDALPVLGTGTFLIPAALILAVKGEGFLAVGCLLLYLVTSSVRQFLEPRFIGAKMGISPLLVFLSVYLGVLVYGLGGFLLGPLSAFLIYGILKEWNILDFGNVE